MYARPYLQRLLRGNITGTFRGVPCEVDWARSKHATLLLQEPTATFFFFVSTSKRGRSSRTNKAKSTPSHTIQGNAHGTTPTHADTYLPMAGKTLSSRAPLKRNQTSNPDVPASSRGAISRPLRRLFYGGRRTQTTHDKGKSRLTVAPLYHENREFLLRPLE